MCRTVASCRGLHVMPAEVSEVNGAWMAVVAAECREREAEAEAEDASLARTCQAKSSEGGGGDGTELARATIPSELRAALYSTSKWLVRRPKHHHHRRRRRLTPLRPTPPTTQSLTSPLRISRLRLITPAHILLLLHHRPRSSLARRRLRPAASHPPSTPTCRKPPSKLASHNPPWIGYRECLLLPKEWVVAEVLLSR